MNFADFCCVTFYPKMSRYPKLCTTKFLCVAVRQRNPIYYSWTSKHFDKSFISKKNIFWVVWVPLVSQSCYNCVLTKKLKEHKNFISIPLL